MDGVNSAARVRIEVGSPARNGETRCDVLVKAGTSIATWGPTRLLRFTFRTTLARCCPRADAKTNSYSPTNATPGCQVKVPSASSFAPIGRGPRPEAVRRNAFVACVFNSIRSSSSLWMVTTPDLG